MNTLPPTLQAHLKRLQVKFTHSLPEKIRLLRLALDAFLEDPTQAEPYTVLARQLHKLAGAGTIFGHPEVSTQARAMELLTASVHEAPHVPSTYVRDLNTALDVLRQAAEKPFTPVADAWPEALLAPPQPASPTRHPNVPRAHVFVIDDDADQGTYLANHLKGEGYHVNTFTTLAAFHEALEGFHPDAVLMDLGFPEGDHAGATQIAALQRQRLTPLPVLFMSARDDVASRVEAVRAGGTHFFPKPLDLPRLYTALAQVTTTSPDAAYRILVVDEAASQAPFVATLLEMEGMTVRLVQDTTQMLEALDLFQPELVLLPLAQAAERGAQLTTVLRQHQRYARLPVLLLASDPTPEQNLEALSLGGDGLIDTACPPPLIAKAVEARVRRTRIPGVDTAPSHTPPCRVLVAEDDPEFLSMVRLVLEAQGKFVVEACNDGYEALERATPFKPDLILLDVMMPGMDGPKTLEALKQHPDLAQVPAAFMTVRTQAHELDAYKAVGADDVIPKPFDLALLPNTLSDIRTRYHA